MVTWRIAPQVVGDTKLIVRNITLFVKCIDEFKFKTLHFYAIVVVLFSP